MGAESRYIRRVQWWKDDIVFLPRTRHHLWWLMHNCIAHPLLGIYPSKLTVFLHDWSSQHLNLKDKLRHSPFPEITNYGKWLWHNTVAHVLIGLFPMTLTFYYHDISADSMNVDNWL